eukprot:gene1370-2643_t
MRCLPLFLIICVVPTIAFLGCTNKKSFSPSKLNARKKNVVIEVTSKSKVQKKSLKAEGKQSVYDSVYEEQVEDQKNIIEKAIDSPFSKVLEICFNPTTLLLALYVSSVGWSKVLWFQRILKIFGKGALASGDGKVETVEDLPFQIFECEKCQMEMRPARGRAETIFGRERFRCPRCGSKASAYFNVEDMTDPRAVARAERLEKEKNSDDEYSNEENSDDSNMVAKNSRNDDYEAFC